MASKVKTVAKKVGYIRQVKPGDKFGGFALYSSPPEAKGFDAVKSLVATNEDPRELMEQSMDTFDETNVLNCGPLGCDACLAGNPPGGNVDLACETCGHASCEVGA